MKRITLCGMLLAACIAAGAQNMTESTFAGTPALDSKSQGMTLAGAQGSTFSAILAASETDVTVAGTKATVTFPMLTSSDTGLTSIDYAVSINGTTVTSTAQVDIPAAQNYVSDIALEFDTPADAMPYEAAFTLLAANGDMSNAAETPLTMTFCNVSRYVERNSLVEEYTGTGCGNCPRGLQGMDNLHERFGDRFVGLAIHKYNSDDPMYPHYYKTPDELTSAPSCIIDRKHVTDPYYGDTYLKDDVRNVFGRYAAIPAKADLQVSAAWATSARKAIDIKVTFESLMKDSYQLVYAVTADSIEGTTVSWKQHNYLINEDTATLPDDLKKFGGGGEYGLGTFFWCYNDVVIGSSYSSQMLNLGQSIGEAAPGKQYDFSYTVKMPNTPALSNALKNSYGNIYGVVYAIGSDGKVAQAAKYRIPDFTDGIVEISGDSRKAPQYRCNIAGMRIAGNASSYPGILIINGKKIITKK